MTTLFIIAAVWLLIGSIFLISWIKFHKNLPTQEQIMDKKVNTDFTCFNVEKSRYFDNNIRICKKSYPEYPIAVFSNTDDLREVVNNLTIQEAAEIAYIHQNFNKIWQKL